MKIGNFLAVQWLGLRASNEGDMVLIPAWTTKILHAMNLAKKKISIFMLVIELPWDNIHKYWF